MGKNKKNRNRNKIRTPETVNQPGNTNQVLQPPIIPSRLLILLILIVSALAISLFAGSYGHDFAYDDIAVVKENRFVQQGIAGIPSILRSQYFEGYDPHTNARAYRPVSLVTYALEKEFFGLNASAHHAVNILLYAILAIFLLLALLRLLKNFHWSLAFVTTILFVVHPVHVDVVANIKSRDELLGFLNWTLALLFLLDHVDQPRRWKALFSYIFFFLSIASKENLLTTLACIPLCLYFFRELSWPRILKKALPYAGLFLLFILIRASVIGQAGDNSARITYQDNPILAATNFSERVGTNIYTMGMYLKTLIYPIRLSCDYSYNSIPVRPLTDAPVIGYLLLYILLITIAVLGFKRKNIFSFCILWFLITISIVSSVFIMSSNAYADRFLFTPSLSICLAAGYLLYKLAGILKGQNLVRAITTRRIVAMVVFLVVISLWSGKIIQYVPVWKDDLTLFKYNLEVNPNNSRMHKNYGGEMVRQAIVLRNDTSFQRTGDTARINSLARTGIIELKKAKAIFPGDAVGHIHEGNANILLGDFVEAENNLRNALTIDPNNRFAFISLGYTFYMTGRYPEAAATWEKINPEMRSPSDNYNLYLAYLMVGDQQKANYYKVLSGK